MSWIQATIAFMKHCLGAGCLAFAANAYNGGMLCIVVLLPLAGLISIFCSLLMVKTMDLIERQNPKLRLSTFEEVAQVVAGRWAYVGMKIAFGMTLFAIAVCYVGVPATYLNKLFPYALPGEWAWMLIFAGLYVPLAWLKSLRFLSKIAVIGVVASALTVVVIAVSAIRYGGADKTALCPDFDHQDWDWFPKDHFPLDDNEEIPVIKFLTSFSTWIFGFGSVVIAPSIRSQMKNKQECGRALIVCRILCFEIETI